MIEKPLEDIAQGKLWKEAEDYTDRDSLTSEKGENGNRTFREERLRIIGKPPHMSRTVIHSESVLPLFKGEGNTNFLCGKCGTVLAEHVWKYSISYIVVQCPSCRFFNEFPAIESIKLAILGSVALGRGDHSLNGVIRLIRS